MKGEPSHLDPALQMRLEQVARHCRAARRARCVKRFGWAAFGLTLFFTALFYFVSPDGPVPPVLLGVYLAALAIVFWVLVGAPSRVPITLKQVALFLDERHPELNNRIATAVEMSEYHGEYASPWIIARFLEETTPLVRDTSFSDELEYGPVLQQTISGLCIALSAAIVILVSGELWLSGIGFLLPEDTRLYAALPFTVEPGDARVRRGDNLTVRIRANAPEANVFVRWRYDSGGWETADADTGTAEKEFFHRFRDIQSDIEYQVAQGRRRSETYRITAWTPPEVNAIDLVYRYPEYLGRAPEAVPNGGNITAMEGTDVEMTVFVNKKIASATMIFDGGEAIPLKKRADQTWEAGLEVRYDDVYRIELVDLDGEPSEYNPEYTVTARRDKPPEIRIEFPHGDNEVTALDEVPFDFQVSDDFGFNSFGIQYEINGKDPVRVALNDARGLLLEAEGHHDLQLEELDLAAGDFVTWTVWANDTKPDRNMYETLGDPYFLEIRPFKRRYREAVSGAGGQGGGQGEQEIAGAQKDIIIATWNLRRNAERLRPNDFETQRDTITETQKNLLDKVVQAAGLMSQGKTEMIELRKAMNEAIDALGRAQLPDPKPALSEATTHERTAYRIILKMMPDESEVRQDASQSGGGGGGDQSRPDISALEMDRNRNFYEEESLTQEQQAVADEILNAIKELARRQQGVNEEIDRLISEYQNARTEEERERVRRKLERLAEEQRRNLEQLDRVRQDMASGDLSNEQVRDATDSLEAARRQMNRSLEQIQNDQMQQARASGSRAADALDDIRDHLQQFSREAAARHMRDLVNRLEELRQRQHEIAESVEERRAESASPSLEGHEETVEKGDQLEAEKDALADDFVKMMEDAGELAERARQTQELMARDLGDWLRQTSKDGILEDIEETRQIVHYGLWDAALEEEQRIARKFDKAAERLESVADLLVDDDVDGMRRALAHLDNLLQEQRESEAAAQSATESPESEGATQQSEGESGSEEPAESASRAEGASGDGGATANTGDGDAESAMRRFVREDYADWIDELRNAESLLPVDNAARGRISRVREGVEQYRRQWRERALAPQYDLFLEKTVRPLEEAARELQREIDRSLNTREFVVADEGDVPQKYKKRVADYFKELSESEGTR